MNQTIKISNKCFIINGYLNGKYPTVTVEHNSNGVRYFGSFTSTPSDFQIYSLYDGYDHQNKKIKEIRKVVNHFLKQLSK